MSLVELLMAAGYDVAAAATGPDAVAEASRFRPDVVLLDLGLPGFDGYEVARRLRADPSLASVKLLALTGWGAPGDLERTKQAGFQAHLTKPIEPQALQECLALWA
jgi:CheY-like chemotaxis protein